MPGSRRAALAPTAAGPRLHNILASAHYTDDNTAEQKHQHRPVSQLLIGDKHPVVQIAKQRRPRRLIGIDHRGQTPAGSVDIHPQYVIARKGNALHRQQAIDKQIVFTELPLLRQLRHRAGLVAAKVPCQLRSIGLFGVRQQFGAAGVEPQNLPREGHAILRALAPVNQSQRRNGRGNTGALQGLGRTQ